MQQTTTTTEKTTGHNAATSTLAVIGFIVLILVGIVLAIWAARYIPLAFNGTGTSNTDTTLTAVPSTTLSFDSTQTVTSTTTATSTDYTVPTQPTEPGQSQPAAPNTYQPTQYQTIAYPYYVPGSTPVQVPVSNYGLANLTVKITDIGYLDRNGRFVSDDSMNADDEFVVKILVTNTGTNSTGNWNIRVVFPTQNDRSFDFDQNEPSLAPGASLPLTLDLTRGKLDVGNHQTVKVTVDANHDVNESNENDNTDSQDFDVRK
ncbi:MAG TPA: CARDB domain-containing protein [Candidatus Paceibacterota bacterium]|nr:CARDB domain-containing protein [Candidatus Paceibacterota bacterium]